MSDLANELLEAAQEMEQIAKGRDTGAIVHVPDMVDVKKIRSGFHLTQKRFAERFGFSESSIKDWEQGRRKPERAARLFLQVIEREPQAVKRALLLEN
ncbi:MAG: helix-turn-helix domain-containing protein [Halopseudomonas aestusnigri]